MSTTSITVYLEEHHELRPGPLDVVGVEVPVHLVVGVPHLSLQVPEGGHDLLLVVQPRRNVLHSEPVGLLGQSSHLYQSVGEITVLEQRHQ